MAPTDEAAGPAGEASAGVEESIRRSWEAGDMEAAATLAIRSYGPELLGYLHAMVHSADPDELFSRLCEQLWKHLPG